MTPLDIMLLGRAGPRVSTDPDALAWAAAVTAAGGTYSAGTLAALSTLFVTLRAASIWPSKMTFFNPVCGDQLAAARVQYKSGVWAQAAVTGLVDADYAEATGIKGNGTSKYIDSGVTISTMPGGGNNHLGFYAASMETSGNASFVSGDGGSSAFTGYALDIISGSNRYYADDNSVGGAAVANSATGVVAAAYLVGSQTAVNSTNLYRAGVNVNAFTGNTTGATISDARTLYVLAHNGAGTAARWSAAYCRCYHGGSSLTAGNVTNLKAALDTFNSTFGRNV